jgi:hypothetical protein
VSERIAGDPPDHVRDVAHPARWRQGGRRVDGASGRGAEVVSYELAQLRAGVLVQTRRSSADRAAEMRDARCRGCCSCVRMTAVDHRSRKRGSSRSRRVPSKPRRPGAIRGRCTPPRCGETSERGIDISTNRTEHLDEFVGQRFDVVVTRATGPERSARRSRRTPTWCTGASRIPRDGANHCASLRAFERTATELWTRIEFQLPTFEEAPTRRSTHA